jgi:hypothetical protein
MDHEEATATMMMTVVGLALMSLPDVLQERMTVVGLVLMNRPDGLQLDIMMIMINHPENTITRMSRQDANKEIMTTKEILNDVLDTMMSLPPVLRVNLVHDEALLMKLQVKMRVQKEDPSWQLVV